jgi:hypothetical protein
LQDAAAPDSSSSALAWAEQNATIVLPGRGRVPFEPYTYQAAYLEDTNRRRLILKARQVGMSNVIAIEALYKALTTPDRQILMISKGGLYAQQLITYCRHTLGGLRHQPEIAQENLTTLAFANGSRIVSLSASPKTGRGFPASDLYLDEFAFALYDQMIYESAVPALAPDGNLTVLSTPNGRGNMYFRLWSGLEGGEWSRHTIHWSDCPRYDEAWAETQRRNMTRQSFAQEYDCDFVASGDAVFAPDDLVKARQDWNPSPIGCDRIINAWDIGRRQDHTVGISIGLRDDIWHEVAYDRLLVPYPVVQSSIDARHLDLGGTTYVESNGVGDPVIENLAVDVEPFTTSVRTKTQAIQALQLLLQQGRFKYGSEQLDRELGLYQWDDKALVQDSVMAAAIASAAAQQPTVDFRPAAGGARPALGDMRHTGAPIRTQQPARQAGIPGAGMGGAGRMRGV